MKILVACKISVLQVEKIIMADLSEIPSNHPEPISNQHFAIFEIDEYVP